MIKKLRYHFILIILILSGTTFADNIFINEEFPTEYKVKQTNTGEVLEIQGFQQHGFIGEPMLPEKTIFVALPPDVDESTVKTQISWYNSTILPGTYNIMPAPPIACTDGISWEGKTNIVNGRDMDIYGMDEFFPKEIVSIEGISQMRKWKFARIKITAALYNPVTKQIQRITSVQYNVSFSKDSGNTPSPNVLADSSFDSIAESTFINFADAKLGYIPPRQNTKNRAAYNNRVSETYCIVTTNDIVSNSTKLSDFKVLKETLGFTVKIITETEYGTDVGQQRAINIREWLKSNYINENITYVLLIGNPDPDHPGSSDSYGDVPMLMCWARRGSSYADVPTDVFYSDLTGNWDLDGDGYYGEYNGDRGVGGVDFAPEVFTGRIPVYSSNLNELDAILQKTIDYQSVLLPLPAWRKKVLLAAAFSNFAKEDNKNWAETDKATLTESMKENFFNPNGYTDFTLYEKAGLCPSNYACDESLNRDNVCDEWKNGYGIVSLNGHGSSSGIYRKYWSKDNGDSIPQGSEMSWSTFFDSGVVGRLDDSMPAITMNCACTNGYPESSNNLGYKMLTQGSIATFTASRVSWYWVGWGGPSRGTSNQNVTYYFNYKLAEKMSNSAGYAAAWMRNYLDNDANYYWMNKMDFNVYGDPSISLLENVNNIKPVAESDSLRTKEEEPIDIQLRVSDFYDDELYIVITQQPEHGTLIVDGYDVTYTPADDFTGWDSFKYVANDGFLDSDEATISILVNNVPFVSESIETLNEDSIEQIEIIYVEENNNELTLIILRHPVHGEIIGTLDNLKYVPQTNFYGVDSFDFKVNDGLEDSNVAKVQLNIMPVNDPPVLKSFTVVLKNWKKHIIPLEIQDVDSDEFEVKILDMPRYGTLSIDGLNLIYKPVYRQKEQDSFRIIVSDFTDDTGVVEVAVIMRKFGGGCTIDGTGDYSLLWLFLLLSSLIIVRIYRRR